MTLDNILKASGAIAAALWFSSCEYVPFTQDIKFKGTLTDTLLATAKGAYYCEGKMNIVCGIQWKCQPIPFADWYGPKFGEKVVRIYQPPSARMTCF